MKAHDFLEAGLQHMKDRAKTYDNPQGERSIGKTVSAFNAITGHNLTEEQGWMFMALLKIVRSQQGEYKSDNYEDLSSYSGLMGEAAYNERVANKISLETKMDGTTFSQEDSEERTRRKEREFLLHYLAHYTSKEKEPDDTVSTITGDWDTCCNSLYAEGYRYIFKTADNHVYASVARPIYEYSITGWQENPHIDGKKSIPIDIVPEEYATRNHSDSLLFLPLTSKSSLEENSKESELIPWHLVPKKYSWAAKDSNGKVCFYASKPKKGTQCWHFPDYETASILLGEQSASLLVNVPWESSLTARSPVKAVLDTPEIPWDNIPKEYKWFARDSNGEGYLYVNKPLGGKYKSWAVSGGSYARAVHYGMPNTGPLENWEDTLIQRPTNHPFSDVPGGQDEHPF